MKAKDLKKGMFIRYDGKIRKINNFCECEQCERRKFLEPILRDVFLSNPEEEIEASYNLSKLVKPFDYVNGNMVSEELEDVENKYILKIMTRESVRENTFIMEEW